MRVDCMAFMPDSVLPFTADLSRNATCKDYWGYFCLPYARG